MTDQALVPTVDGAIMEKVFLHGDLKELSPSQRVTLYLKKCESLRLNPLSEPFQYIVLNGKLTLYAKKDCTEQLRKRDGVSVTSVTPQQIGETYVVTVTVRDREGRVDAATGAVCITGLKGEALSNAMMKAETKGKRRATLSLCGLGITDESEIEGIPGAQIVDVNTQTGEIAMPPAPTQELPTEPTQPDPGGPPTGARGLITEKQQKRFFAIAKQAGWKSEDLKGYLLGRYQIDSSSKIPSVLYDEICEAVKQGPVTAPKEAADLSNSMF